MRFLLLTENLPIFRGAFIKGPEVDSSKDRVKGGGYRFPFWEPTYKLLSGRCISKGLPPLGLGGVTGYWRISQQYPLWGVGAGNEFLGNDNRIPAEFPEG